VAQAVCARGLRAVTLRPRAIFGEDDELLFPKLVDRSVTLFTASPNQRQAMPIAPCRSFIHCRRWPHAPVSSQAAQHGHSTARIAR
jgi:hypothetical protein